MAEFMGDYSGDREDPWQGNQEETQFLVDSLDDAQDLVNGLEAGGIDPYLFVTWNQWSIERARTPDGRFAKGWVVSIGYIRPDGYPPEFADALDDAYGAYGE